MAEAFRVRQLARVAAGMGLAHLPLMPDTLTDEARELLRHFHDLKGEERDRVLQLVRGLAMAAALLGQNLQMSSTRRLLA